MHLARSTIVLLALSFLLLQMIGGGGQRAAEQLVAGDEVSMTDEEAQPQGKDEAVETIYLSDIPWQSASTGWVSMAQGDLPSLDTNFNGGPIAIGGVYYPKGIGVYPLSEIVYRLDGQFSAFESDLGLSDSSSADDPSTGVVFAVYVDGALDYDSGVVRRGHLPGQVHLDIWGAHELRLVVSAAGPPSPQNFAGWAGARLLKQGEPDETLVAETMAPLREQVDDRARQREQDRNDLAASGQAELATYSGLSQTLPSSPGPAAVASDAARSAIVVGNGILNVRYGLGGDDHALLTVLHLPSGRLIVYHADSSVQIAPETRLSLHFDTTPAAADSLRVTPVDDPVFGSGQRVDVLLTGKTVQALITFSLTLFDSSPYYMEQVSVTRSPVGVAGPAISYFETLGPSNLALGGRLRYLGDISRLREASVQDDGLLRRETVDKGKPVFLSSDETGLGLLVAPMDETTGESYFFAQVDPGKVMGRFGFTTGAAARTDNSVSGPRLYLEVTDTTQPRDAFQRFRTFFSRLYPPLPLPAWMRYQWLSWYVYYMDINEDNLRRQIDYIWENLGDLGPWHIIVDAGWYVAEGRPEADWRNVDSDKFPNGLRALVDYAHSKNVRVVLYFSAPYLDSRVQKGDWLGLRALTDSHRDWLIPLGEDETHQSFVYDFENPALRAYLSDVMHDYFVKYDVDGIKLDGLGNAEGAVLTPGERDSFGLVTKVRQPAMNIYRFVHDQAKALKDDAYIESGWLTPLFANTQAHTFRYGDESAAFSSRYPWPGLLEHIDYAAAQSSLWGQRANMGALQGDPNTSDADDQWLQAALALGAQVSLSFDLEAMTPETLSRYRSLMVNYRPFEGDTRHIDALGLKTFATARDGLTFLGILNSSYSATQIDLPLSAYGLSEESLYAFYDVGSDRYGLTQHSLQASLGPRSFRLWVLRSEPGVLWTNSSYAEVSSSSNGMTLVVSGPSGIVGQLRLFAPGATSVKIDGETISVGSNPDGSYFDQEDDGILTLDYDLARPRRIEVQY